MIRKLLTVKLALIFAALVAPLAGQEQDLRRRIEATLFVPDPQPALEARSYGVFEPTPGVIAERVTYSTEFGMRIPVIL